MPNIFYHLLILVCGAFLLAGGWSMLRLAALATTKQDFLASCLCFAGMGACGLIVCHLACLPIDAYGCTHEADWEDTAVRGSFVVLTLGNVVKCWRKPAFRWAILAVVLSGIELETNTKAYLPQPAQSVLHYTALFSWVFTAQAWASSVKNSKGNWLRIKSWNEFSQSKTE